MSGFVVPRSISGRDDPSFIHTSRMMHAEDPLAQVAHALRTAARLRAAFLLHLQCCGLAASLLASPAHGAIFKGEALDNVADIVSWVVLLVGPAILIVLFWLVHILPEKIAEKRRHPQAKAIQTLCLLSLFFGGLLWPLAWLWAYSKPVLHKMAYGTDVADHEPGERNEGDAAVPDAASEPQRPRIKRMAERRSQLADETHKEHA